MPGKAAKVVISERQQELLLEMTTSRRCPTGLAQRAAMILGAFDGQANEQIAERLGCERHAVGLWRRRWQNNFAKLIDAECVGRPGELRRLIEETVLADAPRRGRPSRFTAEQIALMIAVACEPPAKSGRPISHWTQPELADEVVKREIVPAISARHLGRFLKEGGLTTASKPLLA